MFCRCATGDRPLLGRFFQKYHRYATIKPMAGRKKTIDLRAHAGASRASRSVGSGHSPDREQFIPIHTSASESRKDTAEKILIAWSAPEYEHPDRHPHWWLWPGSVALALALLGILIHSYFFVAFITLAFAVVLMYGHRPPREINFRVTREGIFVERTLHRFGDITSFCIFDAVAPYELSLETDRITSPYLRVPLGDLHPNKIRVVLSDYLPEEKHKEFMSDHFARAIGF